MINSKQAARLRDRARRAARGEGKPLTSSAAAKLAEYDAQGPRRPGRPPDPVPDQAEQAAAQPDAVPSSASAPEAAPSSSSASSPAPGPIPSVEAPPRVAPDDRASSATPGASADWRSKYKVGAAGAEDGREMVCEFIGGAWHDGVVALAADIKKAGKPVWPMDPAQLRGLFILATDDILPPKFRMTPKIAAAFETTAIVGQRFYHARAITEALKHDPEHISWMKQQAELEAAELAARAEREAELAKQQAAHRAEPTHAAPAAPPEPAPEPINGTAGAKRRRAVDLSGDTTSRDEPLY